MKTSTKMQLDPQHSAFKLYREVDSISVWDQGTLITPVHLKLIYPGWPRLLCSAPGQGLCFGKGADGLQAVWTCKWNKLRSPSHLKSRTGLMIKGFTWVYFFCSHIATAQCHKNRGSGNDSFQRWALLLHKHLHEIIMNHLKDSVIQLYISSDI